MHSLETIKIENAAIGDWVHWLEFAGTKKERKMFGKIVKIQADGFDVEYSIPAIRYVIKTKIVSMDGK